MFLSGETSHADRARDSVSSDLHRGVIVIFIRDDRRQRPRLNAVTRRKRRAAIEEVTTAHTARRSRALSNFLNGGCHDCTVDYGFGPEDAGLARAIVVLCAAEEIKTCGHCPDPVSRSGVADEPARP